MPALNAEGIILRKYCLRETSYILVVFTKEFGKIRGVIKGVRAPYPQFAGNFEIFTQCQLLFYRKKKTSMDLITQCEMLDYFLPARKDIERLTYANYFIELVNIVTTDYNANDELYQTLLKSLRMLEGTSSAKRVGRIFELKLLGAMGLSPQMHECVECGSDIGQRGRFSVLGGGMLCERCVHRDKEALRVSLGTVNFMRKIQTSELEKTSRIKVSKKVGKETEETLKRFLRYYINRPIRSLGFLEQLEKTGIC
ncbi:DNA repair protein RecO [Candidatus Omnitrophota bacterium]